MLLLVHYSAYISFCVFSNIIKTNKRELINKHVNDDLSTFFSMELVDIKSIRSYLFSLIMGKLYIIQVLWEIP